jgi:hypothetical protein
VDEAVSDRIARRITHCLGALLLIYYVLPAGVFVLVSKEEVLLAALAAAWIMEGARHVFKFDLPMIRPYEERRVASYAFYATALAGAVLLFPLPIAATVILGTSLVDPLAGELRLSHRFGGWYPLLPFVVYAALAVLGLSFLGGWDLRWAAPLAIVAAGIALAVEYPKIPWIDDDLAMTFVPAIALYVVGVIVLGLPG